MQHIIYMRVVEALEVLLCHCGSKPAVRIHSHGVTAHSGGVV